LENSPLSGLDENDFILLLLHLGVVGFQINPAPDRFVQPFPQLCRLNGFEFVAVVSPMLLDESAIVRTAGLCIEVIRQPQFISLPMGDRHPVSAQIIDVELMAETVHQRLRDAVAIRIGIRENE
jgi:hypothetical protein